MWKRYILPSAVLLALAISLAVPSAFAEEQGAPNHTITNRDNTHVYDPDTNTWTATLGELPRVQDGYGNWVNYILSENSTTITVRTGVNTLQYDKTTCSGSFQQGDSGNVGVYSDSYQPYRKTNGTSNWIHVSAVTNAECTTEIIQGGDSIEIHGTKEVAGTGKFVVKYVKRAGEYWKTQLEPTNLSSLTNQHFGVRQILEVPREIHFGGQVRDLANFNGTTFSRAWLENNRANLIDFRNGINFDFDLGWQHLERATVLYHSGERAFLVLDYFRNTQIILPGQTFVIDPTFGYTAGTSYRVFSGAAAGAACPPYTTKDTTYSLYIFLYDSADAGGICGMTAPRWDISSLPTPLLVTDVKVRWDVDTVSNPLNCSWRSIALDPATASAADLATDILDGTLFVSGDTGCTTASTDKVTDLGTSADSNLQTLRGSQSFWSVGVSYDSMTRDGTTRSTRDNTVGHSMELQVVYLATPPSPPSNLSADSQARQVQYNWTQANGTGVTGNYLGRSLDNSTWTNKTSVGNVTAYRDYAYYRPGLLYYVNVTATNGLNSTSAFSSFTMDNYPSAPVTPNTEIINSTAVLVSWGVPVSDGNSAITGYRVESSLGVSCTGFSILTNSTALLNYTDAGLAVGQQYCYRVAAWNGVGISDYSSTVLRFTLPDAVTDLQTTSIGLNNIDIAWTQPGLNGGILLGYRINYTTPSGTPNTILVNNTNSSSTAYSIAGLTDETTYCMRVGAWTYGGNNGSGNTVCATTFGLANFTIGFFDVNQTNSDIFPIRFERSEINSTATNVKVIYPNTADLDCSLYFTMAQDTLTYNNINGTAYDSTMDSEDFVFAGSLNDIVDIRCVDSNTNDTGTYVLQQQGEFVLLEMIRAFRNGDYGTSGMFGALDLVTLIVVISSMIGFNRVNEAVGAVFNSFLIGALAWFEIITFPTIMFGALFIIVLLAYLNTRKD